MRLFLALCAAVVLPGCGENGRGGAFTPTKPPSTGAIDSEPLAKAIRACLKDRGLPTFSGPESRERGGDDAPDWEIRVGNVFIAVYDDPARAESLVSQIESNVDGKSAAENRGRVTVMFSGGGLEKLPGFADGIRDCAFAGS